MDIGQLDTSGQTVLLTPHSRVQTERAIIVSRSTHLFHKKDLANQPTMTSGACARLGDSPRCTAGQVFEREVKALELVFIVKNTCNEYISTDLPYMFRSWELAHLRVRHNCLVMPELP